MAEISVPGSGDAGVLAGAALEALALPGLPAPEVIEGGRGGTGALVIRLPPRSGGILRKPAG